MRLLLVFLWSLFFCFNAQAGNKNFSGFKEKLSQVLVEKIEDDLLYLGQGGNQIKVDDNFTIYERTDSKIKDTYTGETLGNVEKVVGKATIVDSNAKFSVAQITEQKYDLSEDFKPRKYMVKPIKDCLFIHI